MTNKNHRFWSTQPVNIGSKNLPIEPPKPVPSEHMQLPSDFCFTVLSIKDLDEIYTLMTENYVEDSQCSMRLKYSKDFLEWQFTNPLQKKDYMLGVKKDNKLKGFVFASEHNLNISGNAIKAISVNFLCICKNLRNKRLAPLIIKEITRIANSHGIYQAIFTGGIALPFKLVEVQYYHRILNRNALVAFGYFQEQKTDDILNKKYIINEDKDINYRLARLDDYDSIYELYKEKCKNYKLYDEMNYEQFCWSLKTRENIVYVFVEEQDNKIVSFGSFYILNTLCIKKNSEIKTAYFYYHAAENVQKLLQELFIQAKDLGCAMFNILNIFDNRDWFDDLLLQPGDGFLKYYLYNWETTQIKPNDVYFMLP